MRGKEVLLVGVGLLGLSVVANCSGGSSGPGVSGDKCANLFDQFQLME